MDPKVKLFIRIKCDYKYKEQKKMILVTTNTEENADNLTIRLQIK